MNEYLYGINYDYFKYLGEINAASNDLNMLNKYIKNVSTIADKLINEIRILYNKYQLEFKKLKTIKGTNYGKFDITVYRKLIEDYLNLDMADYGMRGVERYHIETKDCKNALKCGRITIELTPDICSDILTNMPLLWSNVINIIREFEASYNNFSIDNYNGAYELAEKIFEYSKIFSDALIYLSEMNKEHDTFLV